jgi:hypothetical protein
LIDIFVEECPTGWNILADTKIIAFESEKEAAIKLALEEVSRLFEKGTPAQFFFRPR